MDLMSSDYICLKGPATEDTDTQPDKWDTFYNEVKKIVSSDITNGAILCDFHKTYTNIFMH